MSTIFSTFWWVEFWLVTLATAQEQPVVTTSLGSIKGLVHQTASGKEFFGFEGIPYAEPPIGKYRFKPAVPGEGWTGVWNATKEPNICVQLPVEQMHPRLPFDVIGSEDCLYINIFTPKPPTQTEGKLLDVLVYIHGGSFFAGHGSMIGPRYIMERDVIMVTFNYRLGILGFLSFENDELPGNNGLKDQVLALRWVNEHIAAFGGDPKKITIAGASAGGASVHFHMLSPMSKGLFQKAIPSSGTALNPWALTTTPRKNAITVAKVLGCPVDDISLTLRCLRERPAERVVKAIDALKVFDSDVIFPIPFAPVIEPSAAGAFIDSHPLDIIKSNKVNDVPVLFCQNDDEGSIVAIWATRTEKELLQYEEQWNSVVPITLLFKNLVEPARADEISKAIRHHFLGDKKIQDNMAGFVKAFSERLFDDGVQKAAMYHAQRQTSPVYSYRFSFRLQEKELSILKFMFPNATYEGGAMHGEDNLYMFDMPSVTRDHIPVWRAMSKTMIDYWLTFITEGPSALWPNVKSGLPKFTFLDIVAPEPEKNRVMREIPIGQSFWDSLDIPENFVSSDNQVEHQEL